MVGDDKVAPGRCLVSYSQGSLSPVPETGGQAFPPQSSIQPLALFLTSESCSNMGGWGKDGVLSETWFKAEI